MTIDWTQVGRGMRQGTYNLLLGAGVSLDSLSGSTDEKYRGPLPTADAFRRDLADLKPLLRAGASIHRIYRSLDPREITHHVTNRFANPTPGPTVRKLCEFRWRRIFTLNIDNALENAYDVNPRRAQKPKSLNFVDPYQEIRDTSVVPILHLHGLVTRPGDGYIFDINRYMRSISTNNLWLHVLGSIIRTEPFLVLGTTLEEPDIAYFLQERTEYTVRTDRPPSILVEPFPDEGTLQDCDDFCLTLCEEKALEFLNDLDVKFPNRPTISSIVEEKLGPLAEKLENHALATQFLSDFEKVPTVRPQDQGDPASFAYGHQANWGVIWDDCDVPRDEFSRARQHVDEASKQEICLLLGEPGVGKSTLLRRLAVEFSRDGKYCFRCRALGHIREEIVADVLSHISGRIILFIDDIGDQVHSINKLRHIISELDVVYVGAERSYRVEHIKRVIGNTGLRYVSMGAVGRKTGASLIRRYIDLGLASARESIQQPKRFASQLSKDVIAIACCRILNDFQPLEKIVGKSYEYANIQEREVYLCTAIASYCFRSGINYNVLSGIVAEYYVENQMNDDAVLPLEFKDVGEDEFVVPLNETLSDSYLRFCQRKHPDSVFNAFCRVAKKLAPYITIEGIRVGDPNCRLNARLYDYDDVVKPLLGMDQANEFYEEMRSVSAWNSRYWHQIALMRLDFAQRAETATEKKTQCDLAVQHARHAKTIEPNHAFTLTTLGKVLFGKMQVVGRATPADLQEALKALDKAIEREERGRGPTVYPYYVLFNGVRSSLEHGAVFGLNKTKEILEHASNVRARFPGDRDLMKEADKMIAALS